MSLSVRLCGEAHLGSRCELLHQSVLEILLVEAHDSAVTRLDAARARLGFDFADVPVIDLCWL